MSRRVSELFDVQNGHSLELNALVETPDRKGVPFVSRGEGDNGISAYVEPIPDNPPASAGCITCALGGTVLTTYVQDLPFYSGFHIAILTPKLKMSKAEMLYFCLCIRANAYRYNYGRQANNTIRDLVIPSMSDIPDWIKCVDVNIFKNMNQPMAQCAVKEYTDTNRKEFRYDDIFKIEKGKRRTKSQMEQGSTPFIGAIDSKNGCRQRIKAKPDHPKNTITVNYDGSIAEAFFQPEPFCASDSVNILYPKGFELTPAIGMFLCALIEKEKFRFNYGRKWHEGRMKKSIINLPVTKDGDPDWDFMEDYIKSLPYSTNL